MSQEYNKVVCKYSASSFEVVVMAKIEHEAELSEDEAWTCAAETPSEFLDLAQAAAHLHCSEKYLRVEVAKRKIPHIPFAGRMLFYRPHLTDFLLSLEVLPQRDRRDREELPSSHLAREIIEMSRFEPRHTKKYINLCDRKSGRVCAQLHPSTNGLDLALPEADGDESLPQIEHLKRVKSIKDLAGYYGPNKGWLAGDGSRFTASPAVAFHVSNAITKDPDDPAWPEIKELLHYACKRQQAD